MLWDSQVAVITTRLFIRCAINISGLAALSLRTRVGKPETFMGITFSSNFLRTLQKGLNWNTAVVLTLCLWNLWFLKGGKFLKTCVFKITSEAQRSIIIPRGRDLSQSFLMKKMPAIATISVTETDGHRSIYLVRRRTT